MQAVTRTASADDYAEIASLNRQVQDQHARAYPTLFRAASPDTLTRAAYEELLAAPGMTVLVAVVGAEVVGYIAIEELERPGTAYRNGQRVLYIHQICVDGPVRGSGGGRVLMDAAFQLSDRLGIARVELDTWAANTVARRFFEAVGFREHNIRLSLDRRLATQGTHVKQADAST